jgi:hypothetical protein
VSHRARISIRNLSRNLRKTRFRMILVRFHRFQRTRKKIINKKINPNPKKGRKKRNNNRENFQLMEILSKIK